LDYEKELKKPLDYERELKKPLDYEKELKSYFLGKRMPKIL
jgi:hypothetical protein